MKQWSGKVGNYDIINYTHVVIPLEENLAI
jgi:hypothetical protein